VDGDSGLAGREASRPRRHLNDTRGRRREWRPAFDRTQARRSMVVKANIDCSNRLVHVIDTVLIPK
jgi:hypothetical protein